MNAENNDLFILGDMNINLNENKSTCPLVKKYEEFISTFGIKQLFQQPARITSISSSLIDYVLTNANDKISQSGIIDIGLSDHQLIYCTRNLIKTKTGLSKYINFGSMKIYTKLLFKEKLEDLNFPNYENFQDANLAYSDLINKLTSVVNTIAPMKKKNVTNNSQDWFDVEVAEKVAFV